MPKKDNKGWSKINSNWWNIIIQLSTIAMWNTHWQNFIGRRGVGGCWTNLWWKGNGKKGDAQSWPLLVHDDGKFLKKNRLLRANYLLPKLSARIYIFLLNYFHIIMKMILYYEICLNIIIKTAQTACLILSMVL